MILSYKDILQKHAYMLDGEAKRIFGQEPSVVIEATEFFLKTIDDPNGISKREKIESIFNNLATLSQERRELEGKRAKSYLRKTISNELITFARNKYGRIRPKEWIKRRGDLWIEVFKKLCVKRLPEEEIIISLQKKDRTREFIKEAIYEIRSRVVDCGLNRGQLVLMEDEDLSKLKFSESPDPEFKLMKEDCQHLIDLIFNPFLNEDNVEILDSPKLHRLLKSEIELEPEQSLVLKLIYQEGMTQEKTGKYLGLSRNQVAYIESKALNNLRKIFKNAELDKEILDYLYA